MVRNLLSLNRRIHSGRYSLRFVIFALLFACVVISTHLSATEFSAETPSLADVFKKYPFESGFHPDSCESLLTEDAVAAMPDSAPKFRKLPLKEKIRLLHAVSNRIFKEMIDNVSTYQMGVLPTETDKVAVYLRILSEESVKQLQPFHFELLAISYELGSLTAQSYKISALSLRNLIAFNEKVLSLGRMPDDRPADALYFNSLLNVMGLQAGRLNTENPVKVWPEIHMAFVNILRAGSRLMNTSPQTFMSQSFSALAAGVLATRRVPMALKPGYVRLLEGFYDSIFSLHNRFLDHKQDRNPEDGEMRSSFMTSLANLAQLKELEDFPKIYSSLENLGLIRPQSRTSH